MSDELPMPRPIRSHEVSVVVGERRRRKPVPFDTIGNDEIELTVADVTKMLRQCDEAMPGLKEFLEQLMVPQLCRDWLKLRARGAE